MNIAQNPNSELSHFAVNTPQVFEIPETFRETARQLQEAMMQYSCAIREFKAVCVTRRYAIRCPR